jgi:hypothetical protein
MTKQKEGAAWKAVDRRQAEQRLGPEGVQNAREHAAETTKLARKLVRLRVPSGFVVVIHGPLIPVLDDDLKPMPASVSPRCYQILWYGHPGAEYPPEVDENVLMRTERGNERVQVWAVESAADAVRIVKAAFNEDVRLPREEAKS